MTRNIDKPCAFMSQVLNHTKHDVFSSFKTSNVFSSVPLFLTSAGDSFKIKASACLKQLNEQTWKTEYLDHLHGVLCVCMRSYGTVNTCTLSIYNYRLNTCGLLWADQIYDACCAIGNRGQRLEPVTYSPVVDQSFYHTSRIDGPLWSRWGKT